MSTWVTTTTPTSLPMASFRSGSSTSGLQAVLPSRSGDVVAIWVSKSKCSAFTLLMLIISAVVIVLTFVKPLFLAGVVVPRAKGRPDLELPH